VTKKITCPTLVAVLFALCLSAEAQQPKKIPRIGFLSPGSSATSGDRTEAFLRGLKELGYVEGKNFIIEHRYAEEKLDRFVELARELVRLKVDVIFVTSIAATAAAKKATQTIPIVTVSGDPVGTGVVAGLPQPGGNITGLSNFDVELVGKRLELLKETVPRLSRLAVLWTPGIPGSDLKLKEIEVAAQSLNLRFHVAEVRGPDDLEPAFFSMKKDHSEALTILRSPIIVNDLTKRIVDLAAKGRLPAMYDDRRFPLFGGLMSYGVNRADLDRRAAMLVDKILQGIKPADLPIEQPTKFELVINNKTAKQLGITIPFEVIRWADEVIK
jgi:putative ABC transport system substrate-binding protein